MLLIFQIQTIKLLIEKKTFKMKRLRLKLCKLKVTVVYKKNLVKIKFHLLNHSVSFFILFNY